MKKEFTLILLLFFTLTSFANNKKSQRSSLEKIEQDTVFLKKYSDALTTLYNRHLGVLDSLNNDSVPARNIELEPRFYRLFVPLAYYYSPVEDTFNPEWKSLGIQNQEYPLDELFPIDNKAFNQTERINHIVNKALLYTYL